MHVTSLQLMHNSKVFNGLRLGGCHPNVCLVWEMVDMVIYFQQSQRTTKLDFLKSSVYLTWFVCSREVGSAKQIELCNTSYSWGCFENRCIGLQLEYVTWGQFYNLFLNKNMHKILSLSMYSTNAQVYEFTTFTPWEQSWIWVLFFKQFNHWKWIFG
jgi:hypothetical protein